MSTLSQWTKVVQQLLVNGMWQNCMLFKLEFEKINRVVFNKVWYTLTINSKKIVVPKKWQKAFECMLVLLCLERDSTD